MGNESKFLSVASVKRRMREVVEGGRGFRSAELIITDNYRESVYVIRDDSTVTMSTRGRLAKCLANFNAQPFAKSQLLLLTSLARCEDESEMERTREPRRSERFPKRCGGGEGGGRRWRTKISGAPTYSGAR